MKSSTDQHRAALAQLQARTLAALVAGPDGDAAWIADHLTDAHPAILTQGIQKVHASNLKSSVGFYLPKFAAKAPIDDWHELTNTHPTVGGDMRLLDYFSELAMGAVEGAGWHDLVRIERAEFRCRLLPPQPQPDVVKQVRELGPLVFDDLGRFDTDFGCFVELRTTWYDIHWIEGHSPADVPVFGPPRKVFFYRSSENDRVRSYVFDDLSGLAVTICFS